MAHKVTEGSKKRSRQRKRRRTEPEDISSPSSSSPSDSESSVSHKSSKIQVDHTAASASQKPYDKPVKTLASNGHKAKRDTPRSTREGQPAQATVFTETPVTVLATNRVDDTSGEEPSSSELLAGNERLAQSQSTELPASNQPHPQATLDADFESWYVRAVASQFENDLDRLRTEAADFKARPREAVAMLSKALRQGVALFGTDDRKLIMGSGSDVKNMLTGNGK